MGLKNGWKSYGVNLYGQAEAGSLYGIATLGYDRFKHEKRSETANVFKASAKAGINLLDYANLRAGPYAGARLMHISQSKAENRTLAQFPIGASAELAKKSGGTVWAFSADAAYLPLAGNKQVQTRYEDVNVFGSSGFEAKAGVRASSKNWTAEVSYQGNIGSSGYRANSVRLNLGYVF